MQADLQVLIDHGLYINLSKSFREDYCSLWRSLFVLDIKTIETIAHRWGIAVDANMYAIMPLSVQADEKVRICHLAPPVPGQQEQTRQSGREAQDGI
jgi:hypothetical protein